MTKLKNTTDTPMTADPLLANVYDLMEPRNKSLYHITIKGNFQAVCGAKLIYHEAVCGQIDSIDYKYLYFFEPRYSELATPFKNKYMLEWICKKCLRIANIC